MFVIDFPVFLSVFELLKEGEVLVVPTDNPMSEKEAWLAFRDVVHGLEYRKPLTTLLCTKGPNLSKPGFIDFKYWLMILGSKPDP